MVKIEAKISIDATDNTKEVFNRATTQAKILENEMDKLKKKHVEAHNEIKSTASTWQSTVTAVSTAYLALKDVLEPVIHLLYEPIELAMIAEKAYTRMNMVMNATGLYTEAASEELKDYIDQWELISTTDDTVIASIASLNMAFGMNVRQVKLAIEASSALAMVTGMDLASANQILLGTFSGMTRQLAKIIPGVTKLSDEELKSGQAIMEVRKQLGYLNTTKILNMATGVDRAAILWEQLKKEIGGAIISGVDWNATYIKVKEVLGKVLDVIKYNREELKRFGTAIFESGIYFLEMFSKTLEIIIPQLENISIFFYELGNVIKVLLIPFLQLVNVTRIFGAALNNNKENITAYRQNFESLNKTWDKSALALLGIKNAAQETKRIGTIPIKVKVDYEDISGKKSAVMEKVSTNKKDNAKQFEEQEKLRKLRQQNLELEKKIQEIKDSPKYKKESEEYKKATSAYNEKVKIYNKEIAEISKVSKAEEEAWNKRSVAQKAWDVLTNKSMSAKSSLPQKPVAPIKPQSVRQVEIFSSKMFVEEKKVSGKDQVAKQKEIMAAIASLERADTVESERQYNERVAKLDELRQKAMDNNLIGVRAEQTRASQLEQAFVQIRLKIMQDFAKAQAEAEMAITEMVGTEEENRIIKFEKEQEILLKLQKEANAKALVNSSEHLNNLDKLREKHNRELIDAQRSIDNEIDNMTGDEFSKREAAYQQNLEKLKRMQADGQISPERYEKVKGQVNQQRAAEKKATGESFYREIGAENIDADTMTKWDNNIKDTSSVLSAGVSGLSSLITSIGSLWGPPGALIAQLINLFTMAPAEFKKILDAIFTAMIDFFPNMMENIPMFFERIALALPDIVHSILGTLLSIPVWIKFINRIGTALWNIVVNLFKKLADPTQWKYLDTIAQEQVDAAQKQYAPAQFGADVADQGENKFKIKDQNAKKAMGKTRQEAIDDINAIATAGSNGDNSLVARIKQGLDDLSKDATKFWGKVETEWRGLWDRTQMAGQWIIDNLNPANWKLGSLQNLNVKPAELVKQGAEILQKAFGDVGDTLQKFMKDPAGTLKEAAGQLYEFTKDPFTVMNKAANRMGDFMMSTFPGLKEPMLQAKAFIEDPLTGLSDASNRLGDFILDKFPFLEPIAEKLRAFRTAAFEVLGKAAERFHSFISAKFPELAHAAGVLEAFVKDPMQGLKDAGSWIKDKVFSATDKFGEQITASSTEFWGKVDDAANKFAPNIQAVADWFHDKIGLSASAFFTKISESATLFFTQLSNSGTVFFTKLSESATVFLSKISDAATTFFNKVGSLGQTIIDGITNGLSTFPDKFFNMGKDIINGLGYALKTFPDKFFNLGKDIVNGFSANFPKLPNTVSTKNIFGFSQGGMVPNVKGSNLIGMFESMGALHAANGIQSVPGVGISDTVPILARAGERVLTPQQSKEYGSSVTLNITLNVASGSQPPNKQDIKEMGERIIEYIKRESKNGRNVLRPSGVY